MQEKRMSEEREIVELTKTLIRFKTLSSRPDEIGRCADFIAGWLKQHGIDFQHTAHNGVPAIAALPRENRARLLLMSHFDVVDAPDALFEPVEKAGKLYGRGSIDDKYAVALSLVLLHHQIKQAAAAGADPSCLPLGILMTGDEEIGGFNGARPSLARIDTDFCIALDGGAVDRMVVREKGIARFTLISRGRAAHGARPWLGQNAVDALIQDYQKMRPFFDTPPDDAHWHRTLNLSIIQAGGSINQVPAEATARFDVRYTENDDMPALFEQLRRTLAGELRLDLLEPVFEGGASPLRDLLLEKTPGTRLVAEHGASDARFLSETGTPGVVWGADGDMSQHSENEHLNIASLRPLYRSLSAFCDALQADSSR